MNSRRKKEKDMNEKTPQAPLKHYNSNTQNNPKTH